MTREEFLAALAECRGMGWRLEFGRYLRTPDGHCPVSAVDARLGGPARVAGDARAAATRLGIADDDFVAITAAADGSNRYGALLRPLLAALGLTKPEAS